MVTSAIGLALLAVLNVLVNPLGYYPTHLVRPLTWSSRSAKTERMTGRPSPDVLIFGSSRSMKLAPTEIMKVRGKTAFNAAVDSARAEDFYALLGFALEGCAWHPSELVIGIDLEAFRDHSSADSRLVSDEILRAYLPADIRWKGYEMMAGALLSYQQSLASMTALEYLVRGFPEATVRFENDGELEYIAEDRAIREGTFRPNIDASIGEYGVRYAGFTGLDARRKEVFEEMIRRAHDAKISVYAFFTPLHPSLLKHLRATRDYDRLHALTVSYLQDLATRVGGVVIRDFTELASFGGEPDDFYDGVHMQRANADRLLRALWKQ